MLQLSHTVFPQTVLSNWAGYSQLWHMSQQCLHHIQVSLWYYIWIFQLGQHFYTCWIIIGFSFYILKFHLNPWFRDYLHTKAHICTSAAAVSNHIVKFVSVAVKLWRTKKYKICAVSLSSSTNKKSSVKWKISWLSSFDASCIWTSYIFTRPIEKSTQTL